MVTVAWVNGRLLAGDEVRVAADDRGFTLGDGLFETIRVSRGQPVLLRFHLRRLCEGAKVLDLGLPPPMRLGDAVRQVAAVNKFTEAVVRLNVSRGVGQRGLATAPGMVPTVIISGHPYQPYPARWYRDGIRAVVTDVLRNEHSPVANIKSLSYIEQVLARQAAQRQGADVGLLLNTRGQIVSADCANLFVVRGHALLTPSLRMGALPGVVRQVLLNIAGGLGLEAAEVELSRPDILAGDEVLLTNVLLEVAPLVSLDGESVGSGSPGPYATHLREAYQRAIGSMSPPQATQA